MLRRIWSEASNLGNPEATALPGIECLGKTNQRVLRGKKTALGVNSWARR